MWSRSGTTWRWVYEIFIFESTLPLRNVTFTLSASQKQHFYNKFSTIINNTITAGLNVQFHSEIHQAMEVRWVVKAKNNGSTVPVHTKHLYLQGNWETVLLLLNFPLLFCYVFGWQPREGYTPWWIRWHQGLPWPVCRTQGLLLGLPFWHTPSLTARCFDSSSLVRGVMMFCCDIFHLSLC